MCENMKILSLWNEMNTTLVIFIVVSKLSSFKCKT